MTRPLSADLGDAANSDVENETSFNAATRSHPVDSLTHVVPGRTGTEATSAMPELPTAYRPRHHAITGAPASDWAAADNAAELVVIEFNQQIIEPGRNRVGVGWELGF